MFETERGEREKREGKKEGGEGKEERRGGVMSLHWVWDTPVLNGWVKQETRKRGRDLGVALQKLRRGYFLEGELSGGDAVQGPEGWQEQRERRVPNPFPAAFMQLKAMPCAVSGGPEEGVCTVARKKFLEH